MAAALGIPLNQTLTIGDGANDLPMIRKAGLGVAYRAKPVVAAAAAARLDHSDLTALPYAQGVPSAEWERAWGSGRPGLARALRLHRQAIVALGLARRAGQRPLASSRQPRRLPPPDTPAPYP